MTVATLPWSQIRPIHCLLFGHHFVGEKKISRRRVHFEADIDTGQPQTGVLFCVLMVSLYAKRNPTTCKLTTAANNLSTDRQQPTSHATVALTGRRVS